MSSLQSTRRRVAGLVGGVLTAALLLSGCSTPASENASDGEAASRLPAAEGSTTYPLVLESPWGETTLEERPERISLVGPGAEIELLGDGLPAVHRGAADVVVVGVGAEQQVPAQRARLCGGGGQQQRDQARGPHFVPQFFVRSTISFT